MKTVLCVFVVVLLIPCVGVSQELPQEALVSWDGASTDITALTSNIRSTGPWNAADAVWSTTDEVVPAVGSQASFKAAIAQAGTAQRRVAEAQQSGHVFVGGGSTNAEGVAGHAPSPWANIIGFDTTSFDDYFALSSISVTLRNRLGADTLDVRWFVEAGGKTYVSGVVATGVGNANTTLTLDDATAIEWFAFDNNANIEIGTALGSSVGSPIFTDVDYVGIHEQLTYTTLGNWHGAFVPQFSATARFYRFPTEASNPDPADGATDVLWNAVLGWTPGEFAATHDVYLGTGFDDVNDATTTVDPAGVYMGSQSETAYALDRLDFGQTYYWRIDEVNAPPSSTIFKGDVWSFTVEPFAYPIDGNNITATASSTHQADTGPENTINGSGLDVNDLHSTEPADMWLSGDEPNAWIEYELDKVHKLYEMWVWNSNGVMESVLGFGIKDVTIEYSTNGTDYLTLGSTHEFVRAPGAPDYAHNTTVDFGGAAAKYVRLTANSNWGGIMPQYGLSEVRFFTIPVHAKEPSPDSGATDVALDVVLGFRAGREAETHDVYLSSDEQAVIDGNAPVTTVTETSYSPLSLDLGTTYYWRVGEVNEAETTTTWQGDIWNFTTHEFFIVDDFEDYNDYSPDEIWATWIDGYGIPENGATVGHPDPDWNAGEHYVETAIVQGGDQAMPFFYDNTGTAASSEGERTFTVPQDWTEAGVQTLALHFHGTAGSTGQLYVKVNGTKVPYDGQAGNLARAGWQAWNIELASFVTNLQSVTTLAIGIDGNGASGTLYFDDIKLYSYSRQFITPAEPNSAGLIGHWKLDGDTLDSSGLGNDGTTGGDPTFVAGKVGSGAIDLDGIGDYVEIDSVADDITTNIFTLTAWIKTTQTGEGSLFGTNDSAGGHELQFGVKDGNVWVDDGPETQFPPAVNDDQWHMLTYVRDEATAYIYVDGALRSTDSATDDPASETRWSIGQEWDPPNPSDEFEGMVDDVRFYNYALSLGEVAWLAGRTEPFDKPF